MLHKKLKYILILLVFSAFCSFSAHSANNYITGKIVNLTVVTHGVMIMLDKGLPTNCANTPYGWMLIKQENTAMTSAVLALWMSGRKSVTVYTSGLDSRIGYCIINQVDPSEISSD